MNKTTHLQHVAIIPDGNRRWAKEKGKSSLEGHTQGAQKTVPELIKTFIKLHIPYVTFWALSTENLVKRPQDELNHLMHLLSFFLQKKIDELNKQNIKIRVIGDITKLPSSIQKLLYKAMEKTKNNTAITVIFAINYGGRDEVLRAIKKLYEKNKGIINGNLTKEEFATCLDTQGIPDPDLIIRTGKEQRVSGFMLWQSEYSEFHFAPYYFPDLTPEKLQEILSDYASRRRRFGGQ